MISNRQKYFRFHVGEGVINPQRGGGEGEFVLDLQPFENPSLRLYFSSKKSLRKSLRLYFSCIKSLGKTLRLYFSSKKIPSKIPSGQDLPFGQP